MVLLVLTLLVAAVSVGLMVAMVVRDDSYLGEIGLMLSMVAGFMAMTYGVLSST